MLLLFDGKPRMSDIDGSPYARALNAPFAVACKQRGNDCWLSSGNFWYQSSNALGPWTPTIPRRPISGR